MAFHWSHRDVSIVLADDEEMQVGRELAGPLQNDAQRW